jgi:hypothetical protein
MSAEIKKLAQQFAKDYPEVAVKLEEGAVLAEQLGAPETFVTPKNNQKISVIQTPLDLKGELARQADNLADRFAKDLGMSFQEYLDKLPLEAVQPEDYLGRLDTPVLVQVPTQKLTLARMVDILGITNYLKAEKVKDWEKDPQKFKTPDQNYLTWVDSGVRFKGQAVDYARSNLASDERGGTVYDGLGLYLANPTILKERYLDLPGSQDVSVSAPYLVFWSGRPRLDFSWAGYTNSRFGSVVAGRNIVTK